jgi:hypothetical protein
MYVKHFLRFPVSFFLAAFILLSAEAVKAQRAHGRVLCAADEMPIDGVCEVCAVGNIDIHTFDDMSDLRAEKCVIGNVAVVGPGYTDDSRFTDLDFGGLRAIRGNLIVKLPFVQFIFESGLHVYGWTTVLNCSWLCYQEAQDFLDAVGTRHRTSKAGVRDCKGN